MQYHCKSDLCGSNDRNIYVLEVDAANHVNISL